MCSTGGTCGTEEPVPARSRKPINKRTKSECFKCGTNKPFVIIRLGDPFCTSCFETYVVHKFRQGLGKTKILYPKETVLLDISGTSPSLAMLYLMASGYDKAQHKKITANPKIIHIDESNLYDYGEATVPGVLRAVETCPDMPRQTFLVPFELVFVRDFQSFTEPFYKANAHSSVVDFSELGVAELTRTARAVFGGVRTLSAREDLHRSLRTQLLYKLAKLLKSSKVLLPPTSTQLAARLLTTVAVGRGAHIPYETNYLDTRVTDVTFINAMREFTDKECAYFIKLKKVAHLTVTQHATLSDPLIGSIGRLTDNFVNGLQHSFPSTISTVLKTANKFRAGKEGCENCSLCLLPVPSSVGDISSTSVGDIPNTSSGDVCKKLEELDIGVCCEGCKIALVECDQGVSKLLPRTNTQDLLDEYLIDH